MVGGNVNYYNCYGKQYIEVSEKKKLKIDNTGISVLGIWRKELKSVCQRDICTVCSFSTSHKS
jgi:hypothetical protein